MVTIGGAGKQGRRLFATGDVLIDGAVMHLVRIAEALRMAAGVVGKPGDVFAETGGSALEVVDRLAVLDRMDRITVSMMDERFDPTGECGNFSRLSRTVWFGRAMAVGMQAIPTETLEGDTPESLAERFEQAIASWLSAHPQGKIVALFGMGDDGHTAGIFPDDDSARFEDRFEESSLVLAYHVENAACSKDRITVTFTLMRKIDHGFAYVCGEGKRPALERLRGDIHELTNRLPAALWKELRDMTVMTDVAETV